MKAIRDKIVQMLQSFDEQMRRSEDITKDVSDLRKESERLRTMLEETAPVVEEMAVKEQAGKTELIRERLYHEINRTTRNLWAMDFLYFRRLENKQLNDITLTNDELKVRLCGWLENLIERFNHIEEQL